MLLREKYIVSKASYQGCNKNDENLEMNQLFYLFIVVNRKTIYEYDRINITKTGVESNRTIIFKPQESCNTMNNCEDCKRLKV